MTTLVTAPGTAPETAPGTAPETAPVVTDATGTPGPTAPTPSPSRAVVRPGVLPAPGPKQWVAACAVGALAPGRGVAVLLPGGGQAALFLLPNGMIYAVDNVDPYARAAVLSRGLTGDRSGEPTVASPLLKQVFSLRTGAALDDEAVALPTYSVRVQHGIVHIGLPLAP